LINVAYAFTLALALVLMPRGSITYGNGRCHVTDQHR